MAAVRRNLSFHWAIFGWAWTVLAVTHAFAITPDDPGPAAIQFALESGENVKSISPYIYGMNFFAGSEEGGTLTNPVTVDRLGGNRWTGYNWENDASNAGNDFEHFSDHFLVDFNDTPAPGDAVKPSLVAAAAKDRALIVTVPIAGYVSADTAGAVSAAQVAPSSRWNQAAPKKAIVYPGSQLSTTPDLSDDYVFTDEFVHWVEETKQPGQQVFYTLDNEPGLWDDTHPRIYPDPPTFADVLEKSVDHAGAIKDAYPNAVVFSPPGWGWGDFTSLSGAPDFTTDPPHPGNGDLDWHEWYLQQLAAVEDAQDRTLIDVLDLHWYTEVIAGGSRITENNNNQAAIDERVQAPRSLWDPTYTESSWITDCCSGGEIQLLNRVQADIDTFKPGTKIAITEYNYGGTNHISGAIAQADALGIFGREEVFAATFWNLHGDANSQFASGAFKMFLDFDGEGGTFGDISIDATTSNIDQSAVYASVDENDPNRMVVIAINRTGDALTTGIAVTHDRIFDHAAVYQLTSASPNPQAAADIELNLVNAFQYTMPAYSVTTFVLISDGLPGDFNRDGLVDAADYTVWRNSFGQSGNLPADGNEDNTVDHEDYAIWKTHYGLSESAGVGSLAQVPEPATLAFAMLAACGLATRRLTR